MALRLRLYSAKISIELVTEYVIGAVKVNWLTVVEPVLAWLGFCFISNALGPRHSLKPEIGQYRRKRAQRIHAGVAAYKCDVDKARHG